MGGGRAVTVGEDGAPCGGRGGHESCKRQPRRLEIVGAKRGKWMGVLHAAFTTCDSFVQSFKGGMKARAEEGRMGGGGLHGWWVGAEPM